MKKFDYKKACDFAEATALLATDDTHALAGGTDILGRMKDDILVDYPAVLLDIKRIEGATGITSEGNIIHIGALTKLSTIAQDATINAA
ncbi:MAG: FAD binding domain-containing protein, partial [Coriobacteriales bacterium]|nr:FAD binding domain-containing protein [Coriobacteriales bacterium]